MRRTTLLALTVLPTVLLGTLLPTVLVSGPAQASPGCLQETGAPGGCDDTAAPLLTSANITVSSTPGFAKTTVSATGAYSDADPDPLSYQCKLDGGSFGGCGPYSGLSAGSHTLVVRAVDSHDDPVAACEGLICGLYTEGAPDHTDASTTFTVGGSGGNGGAPETQITGGPSDPITPGTPVAVRRKLVVTLASSEPATFNCAINARKVPCTAGANVIKKFGSGPQVFVAQAVDADGNFDSTPASLSFYAPLNLSPSQGQAWGKVRSSRSYAGDYVVTKSRGAVLTLGAVRAIRELRLLAPTGPRLGTVAVRVGTGAWIKARLTSAHGEKLRVFELRPTDAKPLSGRIQVKALAVPHGGAVAVDAIVAR